MDTAQRYDELQQRAHAHAEHLERLIVTTMGFILVTLGSGVAILSSSTSVQPYPPFIGMAAGLLVAALLSCSSTLVIRSNLVPSISRNAPAAETQRFCLHNTTSWNKARGFALGAAWVALIYALALVFAAMAVESSTSVSADDLSIASGIALGAIGLLFPVSGFLYVGYRVFGRPSKDLREQLRSGRVINLGGYTPRRP